jgi:hypothetical protein
MSGVFWPHFPPIVEASRGNIGMPQPFLHLGDVGFMGEGENGPVTYALSA